jgi:hypothetical protein
MERLAREPSAFIRPSPSQTALGGVARRTREAVALCEAAGFDVVIVETVGVGQSETMAAEMSDLFVLLMAPAGGDELQGVKRGIMEIADLILVNKADGDLKPAATRTAADYAGALRLLRKRPEDPEGFPKAMLVSAVEGTGLAEAWAEMQAARRLAEGQRPLGRAARGAGAALVRGGRAERRPRAASGRPGLKDRMERLGAAVEAGARTPGGAAAEVLAALEGGGMLDDVAARGLVLLGCGKMGSAMLEGWLAEGLPATSVWVIDPHPSDWVRGIAGLHLNEDLPESPAIALIAVKPQMMEAALPRLAPMGGGGTLFLSVAAGTPIRFYEAVLGLGTPVIRAMPNTPAAIGRGITALIGNRSRPRRRWNWPRRFWRPWARPCGSTTRPRSTRSRACRGRARPMSST